MSNVARAAALAALWCATVLASPQQPTRDSPAAPAPISGTASVVGTVFFDDVPPRPARRAAVTVTNSDNGRAVRTYTDDAGRFILSRLPVGRYLLTALKGGQVTFTYGSPRIGLPGSAIVLAEGQTFSAGTLKMMRGAVITGIVRGVLGRPMPGLSVLATPFQLVAGERRAMRSIQPSFATTDDRGIYRMFGLAPGTYLVSVQNRFGMSSDMAQPTDAEYRAATAAPGAGPMPPSGPSVIFAPVMFPGVSDESAAVPIALSAGEERTGVDMQLQLLATAKVGGTILGVSGQPMISAIRMFATGGSVLGDQFGAGTVSQGALDGAFSITGVAPGTYQLLALAAPLMTNGQPPQAPSLWAMTEVQVTGKDVTGLALSVQPMLKVSGTVVFEGGAKPAEGTRTSVRMLASTPQLFPGSQGTVAPDGTFTVEGIVPGPYRLVTTVSASGWTPKSALFNGKDAFDVPIDIRAGADVTGLVVTMTNKLGEIAGRLVDGQGAPAPRFYVQVFPTDESMWLPDARRVKNARASTDGSFSIPGLPAGEYYVCALTEYDPATASDPSFLGPLVPASVKVTIADGEKKMQVLKLAGG